jgi:hypothetical protein
MRITKEDIKKIEYLNKNNIPNKKIAEIIGCSVRTIERVVNKEHYLQKEETSKFMDVNNIIHEVESGKKYTIKPIKHTFKILLDCDDLYTSRQYICILIDNKYVYQVIGNITNVLDFKTCKLIFDQKIIQYVTKLVHKHYEYMTDKVRYEYYV